MGVQSLGYNLSCPGSQPYSCNKPSSSLGAYSHRRLWQEPHGTCPALSTANTDTVENAQEDSLLEAQPGGDGMSASKQYKQNLDGIMESFVQDMDASIQGTLS